jgi:hypothetical protein
MRNRSSIAILIAVFVLPALIARQVPTSPHVTSSEPRRQASMDEGRKLRAQNRSRMRSTSSTPLWGSPKNSAAKIPVPPPA